MFYKYISLSLGEEQHCWEYEKWPAFYGKKSAEQLIQLKEISKMKKV